MEIEGDIRARVCYPRQETWMHPEIYAIYQPVPMSSIKEKKEKKSKKHSQYYPPSSPTL